MSLGALNAPSFIPCPPIPTIVSEWAALVPLACHLASQRVDYITTGEVALLGRLSLGLFPKLGTLSGLARLMKRGTEYLDYASTTGGTSRTVWDVKWGSVFPCANGAASAAITDYLRNRHYERPLLMPETREQQLQGRDAIDSTKTSRTRRSQILHVYYFEFNEAKKAFAPFRIESITASVPGQTLIILVLLAVAVLCSLVGAYGTTVILVNTALSQLIAWMVPIYRPPGYLRNNEAHDACMLVAANENAMEWHLYSGDRAIVDTLLNKPMFTLPDGRQAKAAACWFTFAHLLQLTGLIYVAAQKGWDGICLFVLLVLHWALHYSFGSQTSVSEWLRTEHVGAKVKTFEFSSRQAMLGAIQVFSETKITRWMDTILVPHPRREIWLQGLQHNNFKEKGSQLGPDDAVRVQSLLEASFAAADELRREFGCVGRA
ncbi:uncharacterized protein NFIA_072720 [Aspergillus fischeri NRRL 181]|uniref:Uncharacterized protein n=1 Tax=Neosartorya fischeri (strain ATCC 1020 / DSM 3700 / CBS 544.65 / FGSC A1164 / JCM 1740 / NRRL 181 / WB 181) TaxID=331117 RepID=A1DDA1_NEOFI|nr:uncharacterized protein NFIA_072720 [Aspergillus fischeri NRRL 181]EAW17358.1 hypothetical protein NFIA_072720 [Aspergillus fischeri NRRL 181]KAG2014457.1 hypothetical protein GB937_006682 [Aspergillus fischeri]